MATPETWPENRAYRTTLQRPNKCAICNQVMPPGTRVVISNGLVYPPDSPPAIAALEKTYRPEVPAWF